MKKDFFTVGPAALYPNIDIYLRDFLALGYGSISHRSEEFRNIYKNTVSELKQLLNIPDSYAILFCGSASEIWERILLNTVIQETTHLSYGDFSKRFYDYAISLKLKSELIEKPDGTSFTLHDDVNISSKSELISICLNETSTGACIDPELVYKIRKKNPNVLIALDIVSAVPFVNIDWNQLDMAYFSGQKGFGMPTSIGVWIVNEKSIHKANDKLKNHQNIGAHNQLPQLIKHYENFETPSTPNVLAIYLLGKIANSLNKQNFNSLSAKHKNRAASIYSFFENTSMPPFVKEKNIRSTTTIVIETNEKTLRLYDALYHQHIAVSKGYGKYKDKHIRLGNFPANIDMVDSFEKMIAICREFL